MNSDKPVENFKVILEKLNSYNLYICLPKFYTEVNHPTINIPLLSLTYKKTFTLKWLL